MIKQAKRRYIWLLAAIAAAIAGTVAIFSKSGTCTDFVGVAGGCNSGPSVPIIIVGAVFWSLAIWLFYVWLKDRRA